VGTRVAAVGLLAGAGALPEAIARAVKSGDHTLVCVQVAGESAALAATADHYLHISAGALGELLDAFRDHGVREAVVAGRFARQDFLGHAGVADAALARALRSLADHRDMPLFDGLARVLADGGITLVAQTRFVGHLLAPPGLLSARGPTPEEAHDLAFGRAVARRVADLDIGQTLVVRRGIILAVEAAEGTDATIHRAGTLAPDTVVVKVSRNRQDPRFDIPVVGPETIAAMRDAAARVLGIDARRTLLLDRDRMIADADAAGIAVEAADVPPLGLPVDAGI
jgi:DUF1009 family protein